jgi:TPR repeat protein
MTFSPKPVFAAVAPMLARILAPVLALLLSLAAPASAGPYEDASTAYVKGDYATALRLWRPLAEQGVEGAQYGLGLMYDKGRGVSQDFVYAHMWFDLSAAQGNGSALTSRDTAARRMSPAQVAEAQKLAREWHEERKQ